MLAECSSLREARSLLLRTEYVDGEGWMTKEMEPVRLDELPTRQAPLPPGNDFELHQELTLPGGRAMHRFALTRSAAAKLHGRIATEAKWLAPLTFGGVKRSNVGGFHSHEQAFRSRRQPMGAWYGRLLESVLLPALHVLDGGQPSTIRYEDQMALIEPRIAGWLNRSSEHDFNRLHTHGKDVAWSLVYYVDPGQPAQPAQAAQAAQVDGGALLVKVQPPAGPGRTAAAADPEAVAPEAHRTDGGHESGSSDADAEGGFYYAIQPAAGELWAFSGDMLHCVMPRALPRPRRVAALHLPLLGLSLRLPWPDTGSEEDAVPRISVACNVYTLTSSHRDELIGFHEDAASPTANERFDCGPWPACATPRKPPKG